MAKTPTLRRFAALYDLHWGYEISSGEKVPLHDPRAFSVTMQFLKDFKPHDLILGGDILDCGAVSHWNKLKPRKVEGFRLLKDAEECRKQVIEPLENMLPKDGRKVYIVGNHEDWLEDVMDKEPALSGLLDLKKLLRLQQWEVIPQGKGTWYGKLYYMHGDTIKGGTHCAKKGVDDYTRNVRFGHHHTYQAFTKTSPIDTELPHTGIALPCLCGREPGYMERIPNRWVQGFQWGYMSESGVPFEEHIAIIINGQVSINGKLYKA